MALVIDIAVALTYYLPKAETEKIIKYENLAMEIKNIWKCNNPSLYPLVISVEGVVTKHFLRYKEDVSLTKNIVRAGQKTVFYNSCVKRQFCVQVIVSILQMCYKVQKFLGYAP
jgi:ethanolamine utilization protein EutP (predicted NTPase)